MTQIGIHISELLQDNDCVIVPKMGGFLNAHPGIPKLEKNQSQLASKISFNTFLTYNDGLLANHMMKKEKLSYNEALDAIEKFVGEFQKEIGAGGKFTIDPIGILYKDARLNFQIEPCKVPDAIIEKPEIRVEQISPEKAEVVEEKIQIEKTIVPEEPVILAEPTRKTFSRSKIVIVILVGLIMTVSLFLFLFPPSDLTIISNDSKSIQRDKEVQEPSVELQQTDPTINIVNRNSEKAVAANDPVNNEPSSSPTVVNPKVPDGKYFVIAGSFKSEDNANKMMEELKSIGFENARFFSDDRQLLLVYYNRFDSRKDAMEYVNMIREKFKKEAWIYTR